MIKKSSKGSRINSCQGEVGHIYTYLRRDIHKKKKKKKKSMQTYGYPHKIAPTETIALLIGADRQTKY